MLKSKLMYLVDILRGLQFWGSFLANFQAKKPQLKVNPQIDPNFKF